MRRRELVLNILLTSFTALIFLFDLSAISSKLISGANYRGVPISLFSAFVILFASLLVLSRKGNIKAASYAFIGLMTAVTTYSIVAYGADLTNSAVAYITIIIIASILISTRFGFLMTVVLSVLLIGIGELQIAGVLSPKLYWKSESLNHYDTVQIAIFFVLIMIVSWLSNRETENSLRRARKSEADLKTERNLLEMKVEERTREIKALQADKLAQLYRSAELGKLSTGIFHDLMSPLSTVVASVEQLERNPGQITEVKDYLSKAIGASKRMGEFLSTIRRQIDQRTMNEVFSANKEVREAIDILKYRAREVGVKLSISDKKQLFVYGNPLKFHQIAVNLISNAIDACEAAKNERGSFMAKQEMIYVTLAKREKSAVFKVTDQGCGIPASIGDNIFDAFYTTKDYSKGMGLGLSTTKQIIEKDFEGTIAFASVPNSGTTFTVTVPLARPS